MPVDDEPLHADDLPLNLRRRLGLSRVVERQIQNYAALREQNGKLPVDEVARLFVLVGRRSDADLVFTNAGRRLVARELGAGSRPPGLARALPERPRRSLALRRMRRLLRGLSPRGRVQTNHKPLSLVIERCLPAQAVAGRQGCSLVLGAVEAVLRRYGVVDSRVVHSACEGDSDERCVWRIDLSPS